MTNKQREILITVLITKGNTTGQIEINSLLTDSQRTILLNMIDKMSDGDIKCVKVDGITIGVKNDK